MANKNASLILAKLPNLIGIPITNKCNNNCEYCLRNKIKNQLYESDDMTLEQVKIIAKKIGNRIKMINISAGYGEALLHPFISEIIDILHYEGIKILCYTNGKVLLKKVNPIEKIDLLIISLNRNEYTDQILKFLSKLNSVVKNHVHISVLVDLKKNDINYLEKIIKFCINYNYILEFNWIFNNTNDLLKDKETLEKELIYLNEKYNYENILFPVNKLYKDIQCKDLWRSLYFTKEGYLRTCCVFYECDKNYNIFTDNLEELWNCQVLQDQRKNFILGFYDNKCKKCPIGFGNIRNIQF